MRSSVPRRITTSRRLLSAVAALASIIAVGMFASPASAATASSRAVDRQVAQLVKLYPGAVRLDATSVRVKPGVIISVPTDRTVRGNPNRCPYETLCLFEHGGFDGMMMQLYYCDFYDLTGMPTGDGRHWNEIISSYVNNQTPGTWSGFFLLLPDSFYREWESVAYDDGGGYVPYNDTLDGVSTC